MKSGICLISLVMPFTRIIHNPCASLSCKPLVSKTLLPAMLISRSVLIVHRRETSDSESTALGRPPLASCLCRHGMPGCAPDILGGHRSRSDGPRSGRFNPSLISQLSAPAEWLSGPLGGHIRRSPLPEGAGLAGVVSGRARVPSGRAAFVAAVPVCGRVVGGWRWE